MQVTVFGPLRSATGQKTVEVNVDPRTVRDVLDAFVEEYPRVRSQLYTADNAIRPSVRVMIDSQKVELDDPCPARSTVALFPAMQGG